MPASAGAAQTTAFAAVPPPVVLRTDLLFQALSSSRIASPHQLNCGAQRRHRRRAPPCAEESTVGHRVDFRTVKQQASFATVLRQYRLAVQSSRAQHFILCPFHRETDPSCRIDHARNCFRCFGCGAKGSILDFVAKLEGSTIKEAAALSSNGAE
jgi:hypothetical protein